MLSGMVIPGDMVEEEDKESTEGTSSDGYRLVSPGIAWCNGHTYPYTPT